MDLILHYLVKNFYWPQSKSTLNENDTGLWGCIVACVKLIWESYSSCFQQVSKKNSPIQVALIGPHVGRLCRGAYEWMGLERELPLLSRCGSLRSQLKHTGGPVHKKVAFALLVLYLFCSENTSIFRLLNVSLYACSIFYLPFFFVCIYI